MVPDTSGTPVPVAVVGDGVAHKIATAVTSNGEMPLLNGVKTNPLDLFVATGLCAVPLDGIAVIVLNSLTTPMKLEELYAPSYVDKGAWFAVAGLGGQVCYPAIPDLVKGGQMKVHEIAPARPYPKPSKHQNPKGYPEMLGGVGLYSFQNRPDETLRGAMSFSIGDDSGQRVGVAFRADYDRDFWGHATSCTLYSAVTSDVAAARDPSHQNNGKDDLEEFFESSVGAGNRNSYAIGKTNTVTIWATFYPPPAALNGVRMQTLTVWVRDIASTLGMG